MKRLLATLVVVASCAAPSFADAATRAYASSGMQGATAIEIPAGGTKQITLKFRNTGTHVWRGSGKLYVSLYATAPYARKSVFKDGTWPSAIQAAKLREALVRPGETGSVVVTLRAPTALGTYREQFQMAVENKAWIYNAVARLSIKVVAPQLGASNGVHAEAYAVMDAKTGEIIDQRNSDDVRSIASITKLMTVMVAHDSGLNPDATVALTRADEVGGGRLRVPIGTELTVRDLVASTIIGSANNAANAVARATGLSDKEFLRRMDEKAVALGMTHSRFADPTGIEVENLSTAKEVAIMARAAFADEWIAAFSAQPTYEVATSKGPHLIKNTNKLVNDTSLHVTAGKTGFINEAGYTLVTRVQKDGRELIVVVLGCDTVTQSFREAKVLAERAWLQGKTAAR
ncbi:MAG: serine hydrolase [Patescibacteria group bacterium]|nr:MAG: serine hydrolase [Patescibacteria group bacterium]